MVFSYRHDVVDLAAGIEAVADVELLLVPVAVELLVIGVGDRVELDLVLGMQHGFGIAAKVGTGHGDDVGFIAGYELAIAVAQLVVGVGGNRVKLIHGNRAIVVDFDVRGFQL